MHNRIARATRLTAFALFASCTAAILTGCESGPKVVKPTADDAARVAEYDSLLEQGVNPATQREALNHIRSQGVDELRAWMLGEEPATEEDLGKARWSFGNAIKAYNRGVDWPAAPTLRIGRASGAIKADGVLNEAAWKSATTVQIAYAAVSTKKLDPPTGIVKLAWDDKALYAAFDIRDSDIIAPPDAKSIYVSQNDSAELFYMENARWGVYWELNAGPQGAVYDALMMKYPDKWGGVQREDESLEGMTIGVVVNGTINQPGDTDTGYVLEVAIPWSQLRASGRAPKKGDGGWMLVGNSDRNGEKIRYYAHLPITGWFHNVWGHSPVVFE